MNYRPAPASLVALAKRSAALLAPVLFLSACTGGGPETQSNIAPPTDPSDSNYSGPPPATDDVQRFKIFLWDNIETAQRCGACHGTGGQAPTFARDDDINLAYQEANTIVDLNTPGDSFIVSKVGGGHNCWLDNNQACADTLTSYISNWAGDSSNSSTEIELTDPPIKDPGATKNFPADPTLFQANIYPLLAANCSGCHSENSGTAISPFFASDDIATAYDAAKSKINLDVTENSRLVIRLLDEFHNCWSDCTADGNAMLAAIQNFADGIPLDQIDPSLVTSRAVTLLDGIPASSGGRYEAFAIATWQFKAGSGSTAFDTSGVEPALNLTMTGDYEWVGGFGINLMGGKAQGSTSSSAKLHDLIKATNEYSIEAWVAPANVTQEGPARIITYSGGPTTRNFTLGQTLYNYDFLNRSTESDANGNPALSTADADERLQAVLQHVVVTYDPVNGRSIYVNGEHTGDIDSVAGGTLNDWDNTFALVMGSETSGDDEWSGVVKFASIHNRSLSPEQIMQNFEAGVGERFFLLFNISNVINVPRAYVVFEVSQFDSYSYLFNEPFFTSLDDEAPDNVPLQGMSIGINGKEPPVGQTFRALGKPDPLLLSASRQDISPMGTIVPVQKGPSSDEFFLTFERLGDQTNVRIEADPQPLPPSPDIADQSDIGIRTFDEINATLSQITGVSLNDSNVTSVYQNVKQALPTTEDVGTFASAQQMAVTQLAIEYCSAWMDDTGRRTTDFPGFDFTGNPATALNSTGQDALIDPLLTRVMGTGLASQPAAAAVKQELSLLIGPQDGSAAYQDRNSALIDCVNTNSCEADRTVKVAKGVCAAALGSALMLIQ